MAKPTKKKKKEKSSGCLIGGIVVGVLFLCCGGSAGIDGVIAWQQGLFAKAGISTPGPRLLNYPNTKDGMNQQMEDIMKEHETAGDAKMKETLVIPPRWFEEHFGPERGKKMADQYKQKATEREKRFQSDLRVARISRDEVVEVSSKGDRDLTKAIAGITVKDIPVMHVFAGRAAAAQAIPSAISSTSTASSISWRWPICADKCGVCSMSIACGHHREAHP